MKKTKIDLTNKDFLRRACDNRPDYATICRQTTEGLATYYEGDALKRLIVRWPKEETDKFEWRRDQMLEQYDNYVKEIAESYAEGVFRARMPERRVNNARMNSYLKDEYADWFEDEFAPFSLFLPEMYVVGCIPEAIGPITNMADKETLQGLPYPTIVFPHYCCNFGFEEDGSLAWISFYKTAPPTPRNAANGADNVARRDMQFEIYTADEYCCIDGEGEYVCSGIDADGNEIKGVIEHNYKTIPVVRCVFRSNHSLSDAKRAGFAFMQSIVKIAMGGLTAKGVLLDYMYYSLYPKLKAGEGTIDNMIEAGVGANKPLAIPKDESDIDVGFLEVPIQEFEALERICYERIPKHAYKTARLRDRSPDKVTLASGVSKAYDMVPEVGVLKKVARFLKKSDLAIVTMLDTLSGTADSKPVVEYATTFEVKSVTELNTEIVEFGQALSTSQLPTSTTANILLAKRAYGSMLPDATEKEINAIYEEIKAAAEAEPVEVDDGTGSGGGKAGKVGPPWKEIEPTPE